MKHALHFANKRNSRDIFKNVIKKYCFLVPSYDLFISARKEVFSSLLSELLDNYGTRGGCSKGASFTSRIQVHGKGPRNYHVQPRLVGEGIGEK